MEATKNLDSLILMVGLSQQDEPTIYVVCPRNHMWRTAPVVWGSLGTERIEVYELSLAAKPLKTILMGETEEEPVGDEHLYTVGQSVKVAHLQAADILGYNRVGVIRKLLPFGEYLVDLTDGPDTVRDLLVGDDDIAPLDEGTNNPAS